MLVWRISSAFSKSVNWVVTRLSIVVITSTIFLSWFFSNLKSLLVTIPIKSKFSLTTGIPPILFSFIMANASLTEEFWGSVIGSKIIPLSERFTFLTSADWSEIDMFLWRTPIPPSLAIAMAIFASVTVSIAAETMGILSFIFLENWVETFTWCGSMSE